MQTMGAGRAIAAAAQAAANNKAVRGIATTAGAAAANKLARQVGGRFSEDTIIDGEPHFVVWKDGAPIRAFPHVEDLANQTELRHFDPRLAHMPPLDRRARRRTN